MSKVSFFPEGDMQVRVIGKVHYREAYKNGVRYRETGKYANQVFTISDAWHAQDDFLAIRMHNEKHQIDILIKEKEYKEVGAYNFLEPLQADWV